ncbi:MAG: rRNA pseudouridine synthase [Lachnospiraceae bacterium]|nr:rRNA pseudouridine synthase [Lachnospiraceae bacterium]
MENDDVRLDKYLANNGFGSRSEVKKLIAFGRITVDGTVVTDPAFKVGDGNTIGNGMPDNNSDFVSHVYYMLNKPNGYITAASDAKDRTVMELLGNNRRSGLSPVGRLDKDTEGLLIITDDGKLNHFLTSPKRDVPKKYYALLDGIPDEEGIKKLREGVVFKDFTSRPAVLEIASCDKAAGTSEVYITVTEGKFHEVKRLAISIGCEVKYLKRVSFGGVDLDSELKAGEFRELDPCELECLFASAGMKPDNK